MSQKHFNFLNIAIITVGLVLLISWIFGHYPPHFIANDRCFSLLGCNIGFFGYDAMIHVMSGGLEALIVIWIFLRFQKLHMFGSSFWKNFIIIIVTVCLLGIVWELLELASDQYRTKVLDINLTNPNLLEQPSNIDTTGDMIFSLISASLTVFLFNLRNRNILKQ